MFSDIVKRNFDIITFFFNVQELRKPEETILKTPAKMQSC